VRLTIVKPFAKPKKAGFTQASWYTNASMQRTYTIVKKGSTAHKSALASRHIRNAVVLPAGDSHVLIPQHRKIDFGHNVSHAKNRVQRLRMPNMRSMKAQIEGVMRSIKLTAKDLRTYKKVTGVAVEVESKN